MRVGARFVAAVLCPFAQPSRRVEKREIVQPVLLSVPHPGRAAVAHVSQKLSLVAVVLDRQKQGGGRDARVRCIRSSNNNRRRSRKNFPTGKHTVPCPMAHIRCGDKIEIQMAISGQQVLAGSFFFLLSPCFLVTIQTPTHTQPHFEKSVRKTWCRKMQE